MVRYGVNVIATIINEGLQKAFENLLRNYFFQNCVNREKYF